MTISHTEFDGENEEIASLRMKNKQNYKLSHREHHE